MLVNKVSAELLEFVVNNVGSWSTYVSITEAKSVIKKFIVFNEPGSLSLSDMSTIRLDGNDTATILLNGYNSMEGSLRRHLSDYSKIDSIRRIIQKEVIESFLTGMEIKVSDALGTRVHFEDRGFVGSQLKVFVL